MFQVHTTVLTDTSQDVWNAMNSNALNSQHQLNIVDKEDWQNMQDWQDQVIENPGIDTENPHYLKMRALDHELSSEQIAIERVLRMIIQRKEFYGNQWNMYPPYSVCTSILNNPTDACLGTFSSAKSVPLQKDHYFGALLM